MAQKYSVLGPLPEGSTKPGPLDPGFYFWFFATTVESQKIVAVMSYLKI
jgi:hypothetical protein